MTENILLSKLAAKLRKLQWKTLLRFRDTVTVPTKQGQFTVSCADHVIGKDLFCRREFELDLIRKATTVLREAGKLPGDGKGTVVDIGANIGPIAIGMIQIGLVDKAIVIEPDPRNFALLKRNVEQNRLTDRVICLPYAVSCQSGTVAFELSPTNSGDHRVRTGNAVTGPENQHDEAGRKVIHVESKPLDELLADLPTAFTDDLRLIWIDVQGHEAQAFRGAREVLSRGMPVVAEIWPYGVRRAGVTDDEFCRLAADLWSEAWIEQNGRFERLPVAELARLFDVPDPRGRYFENVMFTGDSPAATQIGERRVA